MGTWAFLCVATGLYHARDWIVALDAPEDCAAGIMDEVRSLDRSLPRDASLRYVGADEIDDCKPSWVIRNALAPRRVFDDQGLEHLGWLSERGVDVPSPPHLLIAFGDDGARWIHEHPEARVLRRSSPHVLLAYLP